MSKDLKAQLELSADAKGVETGVAKAKRSLKDLGVTAASAGKQGADGLDKVATASARTSRSIDVAVAKMQLQAATLGKTSTEIALLELRQKGASRAQIESASAALRSVDAFKAQEAAMEKSRAAATRLATYLGTIAVATVVGLGAAMRSALNVVDEFNDLKDATGASIENISALDRIARETGGTFDQVSSILVKFNSVLKDAQPGKGAGSVFKALNLDIEELKRLDPAEALRATAIAFQQFADDGNKGRAMQELFGKSIKEAGPLLKDLAEANGLVATTSTRSADEIDKYNKNLFKLKANAEDLSRSLTAGLVPVLNRMLEDVKTFGDKASLAGLAGDVIKFKKELDGLQIRKSSPFNFAADIDAQIAETTRKLEAAKVRFNAADTGRPRSAGGGRGFVNPAMASTLPSIEVPPEVTKPKGGDPLAEAKRYLEGLQKQVEKTRELTVYEQALTDIQQRRLGTITPELERSILAASKQVDIAQQAKAALEGMTRAREAAAQMQDRLDQSAMASVAQQMETNQGLREEIELLGLDAAARVVVEQARLSSAIAMKEEELIMARNAEASAAQISALEREIALLKERTNLLGKRGARVTEIEDREKSKEFAKDLNTDLKRAFSDAFADTKNPIKAFGESLYSTVASRLSAAMAESLADSVLKGFGMGATNGGGTDWTGLLSSLFSFDGGGYTGSGSRSGGLDGKGGFIAMMHPQESVIDHTKGGGAGVSVTIINQSGTPVQATATQRGTGADGRQLLEVVISALADDVSNGSGPMARAMEGRYGLRTAMS